MAWAFVQATSGKLNTGSASSTIHYGSNSTAGNRGILIIATYRNGATPTIAVSDAKNGSWTRDVFTTQSDSPFTFEVAIFSVQLASALLSTDNVTITVAGTIDENLIGGYVGLLEYSGLNTSGSPVDVSATNVGTSQVPSTGTTAATGAANELVLIVFGDDAQNNAWGTPPTGTVRVNHMSDSVDGDLWVAEKSSSTSGTTQSGNGTSNNVGSPWAMLIAVYKLAGAAPIVMPPHPTIVRQAVQRAAVW